MIPATKTASALTVALVVGVACLSAAEVETLWRHDSAGGYIDASPAVGDLNVDGRADIVVVSTVGSVVALDADGSELWRRELGEAISVPPTVADVAGEPAPEVLALTNTGRVVCLEGPSGAPLWEFALSGEVSWGYSAIVAADVAGDTSLEVVAADAKGMLACLSGDGTPLWTFTEPRGLKSCPAVGDLDGDGHVEIVIGATGAPLVCVDHTGHERWRLAQEGSTGSAPVLADLDADGRPEILVGIGASLSAVTGTGQLLWSVPMKRELDSAISVGDADGDSRIEIYAADLAGHLACVSPDGEMRWSASVEERVRRSPSIADVDGDGITEILVAGYSWAIHVFEPDGRLDRRVQLPGASNATATIVDPDGDGRLMVVCPATGGPTLALQWPCDLRPQTVVWPEYRFSSTRTGAPHLEKRTLSAAIASMDPGKLYVGPNWLSVRVSNPQSDALQVQLSVRENGVVKSSGAVESSEPTIDSNLIYSIGGREPVHLEFDCVVHEVDPGTAESVRVVAYRKRRVYLAPFATEVHELEEAVARLEILVPRVPDPRSLTKQLRYIQAELPGFRDAMLLAGTMEENRRRTLRDETAVLCTETSNLLSMADYAAETGAPLFAVAANPWAPFGGAEELSEGRTAPAEIAVQGFRGEIESAALNVFNASGSTKTVQIGMEALSGPGAEVSPQDCIVVREVVNTPTQKIDLSADALPLLNQGGALSIGPWEARQLWFTVDTSPLAPGTWQGSVHLKALDVEGSETAADVRIEVWEPALPEEQPLSLCHWGYVHRSILQDQPEAALEDQVSHRTNVFVGLFYPQATCDEEGNLVGDVDFADHDAYLQRHAPHGMILFFSYQGALRGAAHLSPAWRKAHIEYLRAWVSHLAGLGVGYDGFALYPIDEPGLREGLVDRYIEYAELAREADPNILLYTDPVAGASLDDLKRMAPYVDIWCPNRGGIVLAEDDEKLEFVKSTGKSVWTYECADNAKHQSPLGYYRGQAWLAWHHGLTGIGFWSYCTSKFDPWFCGDNDYLLIYQGGPHGTGGVVASKRWEAIRDGIEDYSMLAMLKAASDQAEGRDPEAVQAARRLLSDDAASIASFCSRKTTPGIAGLPGARSDADRQWKHVRSVRESMAGLLVKLNVP